ncbi:MAG TPA: hypothetical protein ENG65_05060 [Candidatus Bathyarchaeota archaeon]|nr:hypothetical protein [Candidatus Bathyarchaeota archaeon]
MKLSDVKVAILYGVVIDKMRSIDDINTILKELGADLLFLGYFRWRGMAMVERQTNVYGLLKKYIQKIKEENPNLIFVGGLAAQELNRIEYDPYNKRMIPEEEVWQIALNPQKYGFNMTGIEFHKNYWRVPEDENYIFPDILNPKFQDLILSFAKAQIDAGVDALWLDGLFWQAEVFYKLAGGREHKAIEEALKAAQKIVLKIKDYAESKGRKIWVGSDAQIDLPYSMPKLDFVTVSPTVSEIREKRLDEDRWTSMISKIKEKYGEIPVFALIEWSYPAAPFARDIPLGVFSQQLNREEQRELIRRLDEFYKEKGIIFIYPVHGGFIGRDASKLAFSKYYKYDALAPEFQTYEQIKELVKK